MEENLRDVLESRIREISLRYGDCVMVQGLGICDRVSMTQRRVNVLVHCFSECQSDEFKIRGRYFRETHNSTRGIRAISVGRVPVSELKLRSLRVQPTRKTTT